MSAVGMDCVSLGITLLIWATGMFTARRRRASAKGQILFSIVMFSMFVADVLLDHGGLSRLEASGRWEIPIPVLIAWFVAILAVMGWGFYRTKAMLAYVPLAGGVSLIFVATILHPSLGYSLTYPLYGVGIVLLLVSSLLTLRQKKDDKGNPNSHP